MDKLQLKLDSKVMIIHNVNTSDCLTNGQLGVLVNIVKTPTGVVDKLIIKLRIKNAGKENRSTHPGVASEYIDCVIIEIVSNQYSVHTKKTWRSSEFYCNSYSVPSESSSRNNFPQNTGTNYSMANESGSGY